MSLSDLTCGLIDLFLALIESFQGVRKPPNIRGLPSGNRGRPAGPGKGVPDPRKQPNSSSGRRFSLLLVTLDVFQRRRLFKPLRRMEGSRSSASSAIRPAAAPHGTLTEALAHAEVAAGPGSPPDAASTQGTGLAAGRGHPGPRSEVTGPAGPIWPRGDTCVSGTVPVAADTDQAGLGLGR